MNEKYKWFCRGSPACEPKGKHTGLPLQKPNLNKLIIKSGGRTM